MSNVQDHVILLLQILKQKHGYGTIFAPEMGVTFFRVDGPSKAAASIASLRSRCNTAVVVRLKFSLANVDCHRPGMRAD